MVKNLLIVLCFVMAGCVNCDPKNIAKAQNSLRTTQAYYDVLVGQLHKKPNDLKVRNAVVAADTALSLAGALQDQWCPSADQVNQAATVAGEAKAQAVKAGVNP